MPKQPGEFIPHSHCNVASGDCFYEGVCLGGCNAKRKQDHEQRIRKLEEANMKWNEELHRKLQELKAATTEPAKRKLVEEAIALLKKDQQPTDLDAVSTTGCKMSFEARPNT